MPNAGPLVGWVRAAALAWSALCVSASADLDAQQSGATGAQVRDSLRTQQDTVVPPRLTNMREVSRTLDEAYPSSLQRRGIGGMARMRLFINEEGAPDTVSLRASTVGGTPLTYSKSNVILSGTYAWQIP